MATDGETRSLSSVGQVIKIPSQSPSANPSLRQQSKRIRTSQSQVSMQKSQMMPQKESTFSEGPSTEIVKKKKSELPESCDCGPDFYSRVLGPTADETILQGLQTVIDLCSKLRVCGEKDESGDEEPERDQELPVRDTSSRFQMKTSRSQTDRNVLSAGFQVNPSVKIASVQTTAYPEMVSEILQTAGFTPEMVSQIMQTSFVDLTPIKPSTTSINMQTSSPSLHSYAMQTSYPEMKSGVIQTSSTLLPRPRPMSPPPSPPVDTASTQSEEIRTISRQTMSEQSRLLSKQTMSEQSRTFSKQTLTSEQPPPGDSGVGGDEHKCICPPEPPEKACRCCSCSSASLKKSSKELGGKTPCICGAKRKSKCDCRPGQKPSASSVGAGEAPLEVKYAVTKISKYKEFTTYEVMKSTKNPPKQMPRGIEGVFVLKKNVGSKGDVEKSQEEIGTKRGVNGSRNSINKNNGARNGNGNRSSSNGIKTNGEGRRPSKIEEVT